MIPASAFVAEAAVTEAVINAAIKADVFTPVSAVPKVSLVSPTPITGSPQESNPRRDDPGSRNPVVILILVVVGPVAGSPDVAISGTNGLLVHGKRWRSKTDRNTEGHLGGGDGSGGGNRRQNEHEQQQLDEVFVFHYSPSVLLERSPCSART